MIEKLRVMECLKMRKFCKIFLNNCCVIFQKHVPQVFGIKAERHAHARASSLKFRKRNGAAKLSRPCQYTRPGLSATQAFKTLFSFLWPSGEARSSLYWWHR